MKKSNLINLSSLNKTWLIDLDGTVFLHNSYKNGEDKLVEGIQKFFQDNINEGDTVIGLTSRKTEYKDITMSSIEKFNLHFDKVIFDLPHGERILINDSKPSGLKTAIAINSTRDKCIEFKFKIDNSL